VVAHSRQLFGLGVVWAAAIADCVRRPDAHMSICRVSVLVCLLLFVCCEDKARTSSCCYQAASIWRDVTAVYFKVLLVACPLVLLETVLRVSSCNKSNQPPWVNQMGFVKRIATVYRSCMLQLASATARCLVQPSSCDEICWTETRTRLRACPLCVAYCMCC
jgi:hypothetical protein